MFTQENIDNITSGVNKISENVNRITSASASTDVEIDSALKNILDAFQGMGVLPYLPLIFLAGVSIGLSILLFIRIAYFFDNYYPSKGFFGSIFNHKFVSSKDVNFVRRVLKAVHEYEPPKKAAYNQAQVLPYEPDSNNYLRTVRYRSSAPSSTFGRVST